MVDSRHSLSRHSLSNSDFHATHPNANSSHACGWLTLQAPIIAYRFSITASWETLGITGPHTVRHPAAPECQGRNYNANHP